MNTGFILFLWLINFDIMFWWISCIPAVRLMWYFRYNLRSRVFISNPELELYDLSSYRLRRAVGDDRKDLIIISFIQTFHQILYTTVRCQKYPWI